MDSDRQVMRGQQGGSRAGFFLVACVFALIPGFCLAQNNGTDSMTITTYYPAPYGIYKNPRLTPRQEPTASAAKQAGTIYFNRTDQKLYIYNGTPPGRWERIGSGSSGTMAGSGFTIRSGHLVSPDVCNDPTYYSGQLCDWDGWYKMITFPLNSFSKPPQVIATIERGPDIGNSSCTDGMGDSVHVSVDQITTTGFRIHAKSSPQWWSTCGHPPNAYEGQVARALVGWIAIGE